MKERQEHIPEGWKAINLREIITERPKSRFKVSDATNFGNYPFFTSGTNILIHNKKQVEGENIFLATGGIANIKYYFGDAAYSTDTYVLTTIDEFNTKYLYYLLLSILFYIDSNYFLGSGLKHLQKTDLKEHSLILPKSTAEQQKIAEVLNKVDEAITQSETLIAKYQRIKTGLMQDLLTKGIDEQGRIRSEKTHAFKESPLGYIPEEWRVEKLGSLAEISSGITLGKKYEGPKTITLPYLRVANVQDGYLDLSEIKYLTVPLSFQGKYELEYGDVLMNEGGDHDKLGRGTIWKGEIKTCLHQNHVFKVRTIREKLLPGFLTLFSGSSHGKSFFLTSSKQSTNLASVNISQLKSFPILTPKIEEQSRIQNVINKHINKSKLIEYEFTKLQKLKTALMQDLLSGKKRVHALLNENESP